MFSKISKAVIATSLVASTMGATMSELESRIEDLELSRDLNSWSFSGELEVRHDSANEKDNKTKTGNSAEKQSMYMRLNVAAKPSDRFSFYGRLAMSKYWNDFIERTSPIAYSPSTGSSSEGRDKNGGSALYVERAFGNYNITKNLVFSFGRLPTIDGPPVHMTKGTARSGSYPLLAYASILDGVALTHGSKVLGGTMALRGVLTPSNFRGADIDSEITDLNGNKIKPSTPMYALMLDYENLGLSWTNRFNFITQYINLSDFYVDFRKSTNVQSTTLDQSQSDLRFDYSGLVFHVESNGLFGTGLDLALTYKKTTTESKGSQVSGASLGMLTGKAEDKVKDAMYLVTARYSFMNRYQIGAEYVSIGEKAFITAATSTDAIDFYDTIGSKGKHFFLTTKFDQNLRMTVGYMMQNIEQTRAQGNLGAITDKNADTDRTAGYVSLIANF